jgi:hypothetical protein
MAGGYSLFQSFFFDLTGRFFGRRLGLTLKPPSVLTPETLRFDAWDLEF